MVEEMDIRMHPFLLLSSKQGRTLKEDTLKNAFDLSGTSTLEEYTSLRRLKLDWTSPYDFKRK